MGKQCSKLKPEEIQDLANTTRFTEEELQEFYKNFRKDYPSGHVILEEFKIIYAKYFPLGDSRDLAEHVFRTYDTNSDNQIDFRELVLGLSVTSRGTVEQKLAWVFKLYDKDNTGRISKDAMLEIITAIYKMMGPLMKVPPDESNPEKKTKKIFEALDRDKDGYVTWQEFQLLARNNSYIGWLFEYQPGPQ